ncbi:hypothetical protein E4U21_004656 [Claviceps maximensis]|nr:hypothetical protein E4U21_004656 [Claviceps maximensis]
MPNPEVSQARTESLNSSSRSTRDYRSGRGGRNRSRVRASRSGDDTITVQSEASRIQHSSIAAPITASNGTTGFQREDISNRGYRGRKRRNRGQRQSGRDGVASHNVSRPPAQRAFGGHLSSGLGGDLNNRSSVLAASLSGDAPEFVPGRLTTFQGLLKFGHVQYVGRLYISSALKDGTPIRKSSKKGCGLQSLNENFTGDVRDATPSCLTILGHITVGVVRISTLLPHHLRFLHILVARLARSRVRPAHIHAQFNAMPGHALLVILWDHHSFASVEKMNPGSSAEKLTMRTAGAVRKYAKTFFHAENTTARSLAMLDFAENVILSSQRDVTVARTRNRCAALKGKSLSCLTVTSKMTGLKESSRATNFVSEPSIAAFIIAPRLATLGRNE